MSQPCGAYPVPSWGGDPAVYISIATCRLNGSRSASFQGFQEPCHSFQFGQLLKSNALGNLQRWSLKAFHQSQCQWAQLLAPVLGHGLLLHLERIDLELVVGPFLHLSAATGTPTVRATCLHFSLYTATFDMTHFVG